MDSADETTITNILTAQGFTTDTTNPDADLIGTFLRHPVTQAVRRALVKRHGALQDSLNAAAANPASSDIQVRIQAGALAELTYVVSLLGPRRVAP